MKTGVANLPLHYGKAPAWLFGRMKELAREITYVIVRERGPDELLTRLSDPFWFQAFGCVLGFDWHSSGLTTTVCGALKEGTRDISQEIGVFVCGGKGATSRKTPQEIEAICSRSPVKAPARRLVYSSRISAKVDSVALQDGYQLYHHSFIFTKDGKWSVVQQGMNVERRWARRYHWLGDDVKDFVCEPHKAVCCDHTAKVLNMVAQESAPCRAASASLAAEDPDKVVAEFAKIETLELPRRHEVSLSDIKAKNLRKILQRTYEAKPCDFESLIGTEGVGPKTVRALALISELVYGRPASCRDPARFSFAHGGKDGHPYPVDRAQYDLSIETLKCAVNLAKVGRSEKLKALRRLGEWYR
jgi:hypothetical protein